MFQHHSLYICSQATLVQNPFIYCILPSESSRFSLWLQRKIHYFCIRTSFSRYPFDCYTPIGFIGCNLIQIPTLVIGSSILTVVSILTVFVCESVTIFITEIEVSLRKFNKKICKDAKKNRMKLRTAQQISASKEMSHMVTFYSGARELCIDSLNSFFYISTIFYGETFQWNVFTDLRFVFRTWIAS